MYTLDTNALIYYLQNDTEAVLILNDLLAQPTTFYISSLTELELFSFPNLSPNEIEKIDTLIKTLSVIAFDSRLARIAGSLRRNYRLKIADCAIAATALFTGTTLVTRNIRDFKKVPALSLLRI